jgi:hypothetical protein
MTVRTVHPMLIALLLTLSLSFASAATERENPTTPPGTVICHSPQASGKYIGSPSIAVTPSGAYLAAHDFFGPESDEHECATGVVYRSTDRGETWTKTAQMQCLFWPKLFIHRGLVYLLAVEKHHGPIVIRRSDDEGMTWTEPLDENTGRLTAVEGQYHTAPGPVIEYKGRLWRAFEDAMGGKRWGERYRALMMSIPVDADLLVASNWTFSNPVARDPEWLDGNFAGWLEGNAVVTPEGDLVNVLRVDVPPKHPEKAAIVTVNEEGTLSSFDPDTGFIPFPGGAKKFTIRHDPVSNQYWTLSSIVLEEFLIDDRSARVRNTLALMRSDDLRQWEVRAIILHHPDVVNHGFQYVDWQFEEDNLIAVCRTAYEDGQGGAHNNHDANFMTFHRIMDFRNLTTDLPKLAP